ncbi:MAG: hypothetical protein LBR26_06885 [Prevotella sp.]|nr:hypothetical protein [Prevotella sp.]
MNKKKKFFGLLAFIAVFAAAIAIVMLLWNALVPPVIGWAAINYWQAAGLMVLCRLLLGGFGRFGRGHFFGGRDCHGHREIHDLKDKMKDMSREERRDYIRNHIWREHPFGKGFFGGRDMSQPEGKPE